MRVLVNQLPALGIKTGIGHYTVELLRCLRAQAGEAQIHAFPEGWVRRARAAAARARPYLEGGQGQAGSAGRLLAQLRGQAMRYARQAGRDVMARYFRLVYRMGKHDLYHEPNFIPLECDFPTVATLHDLSVLRHPEWHPADRANYFEKNFHRGIARCQHFLAISEFGRQEVIRMLNIAPERVTRTYMGIRPGLGPMPADEVARVLRQLNLPSRYLLYLGTIEPRKNLLLLLKAYCSLPAMLRARWPLLLVGSWGWNTTDVATYLHDHARHRGVIHVGYVPEEHLPVIYNGARALVYPSLYEGFGLPPVEMMACGGAVLTSTTGALVETVGSRAHLVPAHDLDGWRTAMARVVEDDDWWRSLRVGVTALAQAYTWERCAEDTWRVYRSLNAQHVNTGGVMEPAYSRPFRAAG